MKPQIPKNNDLIDDKLLKKQNRGSIHVSVREDESMACIKWLDNKPVVAFNTRKPRATMSCKKVEQEREEVFGGKPTKIYKLLQQKHGRRRPC